MKFRILEKVMSGSHHNIIRKIAACATLHNFILAEDGVQEMEEAEDPAGTRGNQTTTPLGMNYHPTLPDEDVFTCVAGVSHTRDALLEVVQELDKEDNVLEGKAASEGRAEYTQLEHALSSTSADCRWRYSRYGFLLV